MHLCDSLELVFIVRKTILASLPCGAPVPLELVGLLHGTISDDANDSEFLWPDALEGTMYNLSSRSLKKSVSFKILIFL